jgi:hypothetical protein
MSEIEMFHQLPRREIFRLRNDVPERSCLWDAVHFLAGHSVEKVLADDMHKRQIFAPVRARSQRENSFSFAQFEREVTGERIRDKIAASKRKGMWIGGPVPLGYDLEAHKLVPNAKEAALASVETHQGLPCTQSGLGRETADGGTKILRPCFTRIEIEFRLSRFAAGSRSSTRKLAS